MRGLELFWTVSVSTGRSNAGKLGLLSTINASDRDCRGPSAGAERYTILRSSTALGSLDSVIG
jgi:hypothetical protein